MDWSFCKTVPSGGGPAKLVGQGDQEQAADVRRIAWLTVPTDAASKSCLNPANRSNRLRQAPATISMAINGLSQEAPSAREQWHVCLCGVESVSDSLFKFWAQMPMYRMAHGSGNAPHTRSASDLLMEMSHDSLICSRSKIASRQCWGREKSLTHLGRSRA